MKNPDFFYKIIPNYVKDISTRLKQLMAYADDILKSARTKGALIEALNQISPSSKEVGLRINIEKTKYMSAQKRIIIKRI